MKKIFPIVIAIAIIIAVVAPILVAAPAAPIAVAEYMNKAHGDHGLGNVNQYFNGVVVPPPWDLPPGLNR